MNGEIRWESRWGKGGEKGLCVCVCVRGGLGVGVERGLVRGVLLLFCWQRSWLSEDLVKSMGWKNTVHFLDDTHCSHRAAFIQINGEDAITLLISFYIMQRHKDVKKWITTDNLAFDLVATTYVASQNESLINNAPQGMRSVILSFKMVISCPFFTLILVTAFHSMPKCCPDLATCRHELILWWGAMNWIEQ